MRITFISDIHGNATALEAVLEDIKQRDIQKTFVLGDLCYKGLDPKCSLEMVRSLNADVIKGNADEWVVRGVRQGEVPEQALSMMNKERDWTYSKLSEEEIEYLKNLPEELNLEYGDVKIHAFHATPNSLFEMVQPFESDEVLSEKLMGTNADIYIYAHIHKPYIRYIDGKCVVNTGSVGLPFDGVKKASYVILNINENSFNTSIVRVEYDVDKVITEIRESDYPNKEIANILE
ncbi:YfcE family phosphodiesterase [Virgibacillus profundi]|uniref:Phosphoesterase n=1 Tax=Virgibacillus profundi TaxID=2024555 RepID=A0A2A2IK51_9BACI|nr:YfcE family phosphodiesterase [Virgibacillus profundi]PAV31530.1 YfcE family phosphodiesterase [Virgibacillus profundi]PXY55716.1 metallophosphoesterase [Virgibacillus profundi]